MRENSILRLKAPKMQTDNHSEPHRCDSSTTPEDNLLLMDNQTSAYNPADNNNKEFEDQVEEVKTEASQNISEHVIQSDPINSLQSGAIDVNPSQDLAKNQVGITRPSTLFTTASTDSLHNPNIEISTVNDSILESRDRSAFLELDQRSHDTSKDEYRESSELNVSYDFIVTTPLNKNQLAATNYLELTRNNPIEFLSSLALDPSIPIAHKTSKQDADGKANHNPEDQTNLVPQCSHNQEPSNHDTTLYTENQDNTLFDVKGDSDTEQPLLADCGMLRSPPKKIRRSRAARGHSNTSGPVSSSKF